MPPYEVRPWKVEDLDSCIALLAQRHQRDLIRLSNLDPAFAESVSTRAGIEGLMRNPRVDGVVAVRGAVPVAFLSGERMLLPPDDFASQFIPPHSIQIPVESHAVADGEEAVGLYRAMYAELARRWVESGFFTHRIAVVPGDAEAQEAWVALGFGRYMSAATRETAVSVAVPRPRSIRVERASPEDIEDVLALADNLNAWHWQSPMFWPVIHIAEPAAREFNLQALRSSDVPYFVAYEGGQAVGMQTFLRPGFTPALIDRASDVYLFEGVVSDAVRGGGVGSSLLRHTMAWAANAGYRTCTLHFASGNPSGAPFWQANGFVPVEHTMERTIDSRISWARPRL